MPTENRSSNTEMVSVPRERALQLINLLAGVASAAHWLADNSEDCGDEGIDCQRVDFEALSDALDKCEELPELPDSVYVRDGWLRAADELRALLAQPAEQNQGEPACWVNGEQLLLCSKSPRHDEPDNPMLHNQPRNIAGSALEDDYCNTPLYTHADPNVRWKAVADEQMKVIEGLRAQLAERTKQLDNALDDIEGLIGAVRHYDKNHQLHNEEGTLRRYRAALSASAEPSAPVERDERADFEAYMRRDFPGVILARRRDSDEYVNLHHYGAWLSWQARAALERKP